MALYASRRGKLVHVKEYETDDGVIIEFNNLTIINLALKLFGPLHERSLTCILFGFQILCSCVAFLLGINLHCGFMAIFELKVYLYGIVIHHILSYTHY